jgi:hypothetical protein
MKWKSLNVKKVETFWDITDIYTDLTKTVVGDVSNAIRKNVVVVLKEHTTQKKKIFKLFLNVKLL